jgi:hypothetical protein
MQLYDVCRRDIATPAWRAYKEEAELVSSGISAGDEYVDKSNLPESTVEITSRFRHRRSSSLAAIETTSTLMAATRRATVATAGEDMPR